MAVTDYNRKKKLEVTSQNDSGTTQDKAQPVILVDGDDSTTGTGDVVIDDSNVSEKSDLAVYDQNGNLLDFEIESIKSYTNDVFNDSGSTVSPPVTFDIDIGSRPAILKELAVLVSDQNTTQSLTITDSGNNTLASTTTFSTPGANNVLFSLSESDYSRVPENETITVEVDSDAAEIGVDTSFSASERLFSISSGQDVVYADSEGGDRSKNIVVEDTFSGDNYVLWPYNSWVRDDSVQAQVCYGDGPSSSEENVEGVWNNAGQNAVLAQHLQDDPLTATDSTANNNDGTVNGATSTSGEFDGGADFDGTDDDINVPLSSDPWSSGSFTLVHWMNYDNLNESDVFSRWSNQFKMGISGNGSTWQLALIDSDSDTILAQNNGPANALNTNEWHCGIETYDGTTPRVFVDASEINYESQSTGNGLTSATSDVRIGERLDGTFNMDGQLDAVRAYSEAKDTTWIQAEQDASPKAGQVYFSQQAAEDTTSAAITLSGSASSTATATGTLQTNRLLSGTVTATSTDTGALTTVDNRVLSGTATSTATANGTLTTVDNRVLSGTATSAANLTGSLINANFLSGSFTSNASATGNLTTLDERTLSGNLGGAATATGNLTTLTEATFSGTATGQATANGLLTLVEPKVLSGTATSTATATGNLTAFDERILSSTATGTADLTGSLINANFLSGSLLSESTATGNLTTFDERILSGSLDSQTTASGSISSLITLRLSGDAQGNATISGTLSDELTLSGAAGMEGNVSGVIVAQRSLEGLAEAKTEAQGDITLFVPEEKRYREFTPQKMATVGRQNALAFLNRIDDPNDRYKGDYIYRSMPRTKSQEFDGYPFIVLEGYTFNDIGDTKNGLLSQFDFDIEFHVYGLENSDDDIEAIDAILDQVNYMVKGKPQLRLAQGAELTRPQFIRQNRFTGIQQKDQPIVRYEVEVRGKLHLDMEALE